MFDPIDNHIEQAQARLLFEYQDAVNLNNFIAAIVTPIQTIESVLADMNNFRSLTTAYGQQLDNIGKIVGIGRAAGQSDSSYLLSIYGQIGVNRSDGLIEDVIAAFLIYTGATDCAVYEFYPAQFEIVTSFTFASMQAETQAQAFIQTVAGVGVYFSGFNSTPPIVEFSFDGPQVGYKSAGFGDLNDASIGGFWSADLG